MSFVLTKPGGWSFGELLLSGQMEDIDAKTADAIDGAGGGTYAPSSQISIGGSGLAVTGPFACSGTASFTGDVNLGNGASDTVTINAELVISQDVEFTNDVTLGNSDTDSINVEGMLTCSREATFNDGIDVTGAVAIDGNVTVTGELTTTGDITTDDDLFVGDQLHVTGLTVLNGDVTIGSSDADSWTQNAQLASRMKFTGLGRVALRMMLLPDTNANISVGDANVLIIPGAVSAARDYTLLAASASSNNDFFWVVAELPNEPPTFQVRFRRESGTNLFTYDTDNTRPFVFFTFRDGQWNTSFLSVID